METITKKKYKETIRRLIRKMTVNNLEIGSSCWVDITYINSPHSFFVRPLGYTPYMPIIQARGEHIDKSEINLGDIVIFRSAILMQDVRGRIMTIEGDMEPVYDMFAVDVGCYERSVPLNRIWSLFYSVELPSLVTHCRLADCFPRGDTWDERVVEAMRYYVEGEQAEIVVKCKTSDVIIVQVFNSCPEDIGTLLALTGYTSFGKFKVNDHFYDENLKPEAPLFYFPPRQLQIKKVIHVRMQSGSIYEKFYAIPLNEYQTYLENQNYLMSYAKSQIEMKCEDLKVNAPIGVLSDNTNKFERAIIKELFIESKMAKINLVDWGYDVEESFCNFRPLPEKYLSIPTKAICCCLHTSQLKAKNLYRFSYPGMEFFITIEEIGERDSPNTVIITPLVNN